MSSTQARTYQPKSLSASSAGTFRNCNRRWKLRYIENLPDPPGEAQLLGSFVHKALEDLLELPAGERTLEKVRQICTDNWDATKANADFVALGYDDNAKVLFKTKAWDFIQGYFKMFDPTEVDVVSREQRLRAKLGTETGEVPFGGIVDLLERTQDGLCVTDYKTGKAPNSRFVDESLAQVWLYAAALISQGEPITSVQLAYIGNGAEKKGQAIVREMDEGAMAKAVNQHGQTWLDVHAAIDSGNFPPKPGPLCGWCPYREHCPEGQAEYKRRNPDWQN